MSNLKVQMKSKAQMIKLKKGKSFDIHLTFELFPSLKLKDH